jgi:quinohemoprotein ethanol dehydrogenase
MLRAAAQLGACVLLLALCACSRPLDTARADASPPVGAGANWPARDADARETAFSRLTQIDAANVGRLGLAWSLELPGEVSLEATPVAVDGVLYFTGSYGKVYAVEAQSGKILWSHDPQVSKTNPFKMRFAFAANRGVAYDNGKIFSVSQDGRLFAFDAKSGQVLWTVQTTPVTSIQTNSGAPRTFNGKVIIGNSNSAPGMRAYVTAYDQATGKQLWRFYTTPGSPEDNRGDPVMEKAATTWSGEFWKSTAGGDVWDGITFDPELNRIYLATGNSVPTDPAVRGPGDNLFVSSVVALDADSGKYVWHYQANPADSWDYDAAAQMTLATVVIDGKPRKVLMQAPKNGFFYVLDRESGKIISAGKLVRVSWADHVDLATGRPAEAKNIRYETGEVMLWPAGIGAHTHQMMSFSPQTGFVYVPISQVGAKMTRRERQADDIYFNGVSIKEYVGDPDDGKGALVAWDPVTQKPAWKVQLADMWNGGAMSTAGNLVFQGTADGYVSAYDARTGKRLWRFYAGMGIIAAPSTYLAGGKQYVSILVGYGGATAAWGDLMNPGWKYRSPRRLLTFALDGKAVLPPSPKPDRTIHPVDDPKVQLAPADIIAGQDLSLNCMYCHGRGARGSGLAPDLRESALALSPDAFYAVVHDGALVENGMPKFSDLSRQQVMQLYAFVRAAARDALNGTHVADTPPPMPADRGAKPAGLVN